MANDKQQKKWPIGQLISEICQPVWWLRNKSEKTLLDAENKTTK